MKLKFSFTYLYHGLPRLGKFSNHLRETLDFQRTPKITKEANSLVPKL